MKTYRVHFTQVVKQREQCIAEVNANSEEEAREKIKFGEYDELEIFNADVLDFDDSEFMIDKITVINED